MEGCRPGTSKSQLHKARRALRAAIAAQTGRTLARPPYRAAPSNQTSRAAIA
jgi:hypothetical protein